MLAKHEGQVRPVNHTINALFTNLHSSSILFQEAVSGAALSVGPAASASTLHPVGTVPRSTVHFNQVKTPVYMVLLKF